MQKQLVLSAFAISVLSVAPAMAADGGTLNDGERAFLIEQMEMSKKAFLASISGISEATHTARHTAQIKEVEANANYPAK
jgi:hypothetical protein